MTVKELRDLEVAFLRSNKSVLTEYGRACRMVLDLAAKDAGDPNTKVQRCASLAAARCSREYDITKEDYWLLRLKQCSALAKTSSPLGSPGNKP
jgi:hypothetical protein